jgi:hypothetical protein
MSTNETASTETETETKITLVVTPSEMKPYRFAIEMQTDDYNQQIIIDWCFGRFGLNSERWSIQSADGVFYVRDQADANLVTAKFDGTIAKPIDMMVD